MSFCPVCGTPAKLRDEEIKVVRKEQVAVNLAAAEALSVLEGLLAPEFDKRNLRELNADLYPVITEGYIRFGMLEEAERALSSFIAFDEAESDAWGNVSGLLEGKLFYAKRDYAAAGKKAVTVFKEAKEKDDYRYMAENPGFLARALFEVKDERWKAYAEQTEKLSNQLGAEPLARELKKEFGLE